MRRFAIRSAVSLAGLLATATALAQAGPIVADLYRLEHVTVVYPSAGPAGQVETARLSAQRRAAFLRGASSVRVTVRRDDQLRPEELNGNLLLLGWENALIGTDEVPSLFKRSADGIEFLDFRDTTSDADLLFAHASPYNTEKLLVFWSRIDPELDRLMPLPMLGSQWGIYHDYLPKEMGMLQEGTTWPPRRNPDAEKPRIPGEPRSSIGGAHYRLTFNPAEVEKGEAETILSAREQALRSAAGLLGVELSGFTASVHVYGDIDGKVALTGSPDPVHTVDRKGELHMLKRYAFSASPHEEIHLLARRHLGPAYLTAMYEGLALARENVYKRMSLDLHAAVLLEKNQLPDLDQLIDESKLRLLSRDVSFPATGLFARWVESTGGRAALTRVYGMPHGKLDDLARMLGGSPAEISASFRSWVIERAKTQASEVAYLKAMARGQEHSLEADYAAVARAMTEALENRPDDPQALYNLGFALVRSGEYAVAEQRLRRLLELPLEPGSRFVLLARFELGRLYDVLGRRDEALEQYRQVRRFPAEGELYRLAGEAIETPVTRESLD